MTDLTGPGRERLQRLLKEYNEYPERHQEIDSQIHEEFCRAVAIVVIDSCGFSRSVRQHGIVNYLARLERLERVVSPIIETHGGRVLRVEADNIFALFSDTESAVRCSAEVQRNVEIANEPLPAASEIYIAIGIGYGRVLLVGDDDAYGDEMNVACKLGEDLAEQGEILLTAAAREAIGDGGPWQFEDSSVRISGLDLTAYKVVR
ncbi:MAG TPA: adenylate/guanylate cyclase domain-containing protein [Chloroflexota bacterium]|nr:adenylate/guanylate cyclase domain-containing protein [Chloroflexota bacterium]